MSPHVISHVREHKGSRNQPSLFCNAMAMVWCKCSSAAPDAAKAALHVVSGAVLPSYIYYDDDDLRRLRHAGDPPRIQ